MVIVLCFFVFFFVWFIIAEGCVNWTCAVARVSACASTCADDGVTSEQCMSCLGPLYYRLCRNCIPLYSAIDGLVTYQGECFASCICAEYAGKKGAVACETQNHYHGVHAIHFFSRK